jgi:hypothetical protein
MTADLPAQPSAGRQPKLARTSVFLAVLGEYATIAVAKAAFEHGLAYLIDH